MTKKWVAFVSLFLLSGTAALANEWSDKFKMIDTDGNGSISRTEWEANVAKLKLDPAPTFTAMDADVNNSVDTDEWVAAEKMAKAFPVACKSATSSWCPKQY
ncbi:hypothetical protein [Hyphomicrobium sp. ghe19]|uniref:hypothetical protein n=1 Tax=Hyphomicrobium sp. ghe19 TaxID=2682968 RepID=UPI0013669644|nr:hypothetical protein HYPP_00669 [Hyphomicrobium sp. ghe19]